MRGPEQNKGLIIFVIEVLGCRIMQLETILVIKNPVG